MRILIIEDDIQLCQTLAYRLKKEGIHADHCHDGAEGLMAARENAHDLILLDRMLPSLSGTEVLSLLSKNPLCPSLFLVHFIYPFSQYSLVRPVFLHESV